MKFIPLYLIVEVTIWCPVILLIAQTIHMLLLLLLLQGYYSAAYEVINNMKKQYPASSQYAHIWMACEQEVTFTKAMLAGNWTLAEECVDNMRAVCQPEADIR